MSARAIPWLLGRASSVRGRAGHTEQLDGYVCDLSQEYADIREKLAIKLLGDPLEGIGRELNGARTHAEFPVNQPGFGNTNQHGRTVSYFVGQGWAKVPKHKIS